MNFCSITRIEKKRCITCMVTFLTGQMKKANNVLALEKALGFFTPAKQRVLMVK